MKQVASFTMAVLLTLSALILLWRFSLEVILFALSLIVAAAVRPLILGLAARGMRPALAALLVFGMILGLAVVLILAVSNSVVSEIAQASTAIGNAYLDIKKQGAGASGIVGLIGRELPPLDQLYSIASSPKGTAAIATFLGATSGIVDVISRLALILVLSIYLSIDYDRFERLWLSLVPVKQREQARSIWRALESRLGAYIRSELVQSVLAAIMLGLLYAAIGVNYPFILAITVALAWFIPLLGTLLIFALVIAVSMLSGPIVTAVAVLGTLLVLFFLEFVVQPRLAGPGHFSSVLVVIVMMALSRVAGVVGLLVAPPVAAAIQIVVQQLLTASSEQPAEDKAGFRERLATARTALATMPEPASPELSSLLDRLTQLVERANLERRRLKN